MITPDHSSSLPSSSATPTDPRKLSLNQLIALLRQCLTCINQLLRDLYHLAKLILHGLQAMFHDGDRAIRVLSARARLARGELSCPTPYSPHFCTNMAFLRLFSFLEVATALIRSISHQIRSAQIYSYIYMYCNGCISPSSILCCSLAFASYILFLNSCVTGK